MILDKQSRAMLDLMIQSDPDDDDNHSFSYPYLQELSNWSDDEVSSVVNGLVAKGLAGHIQYKKESFLGYAVEPIQGSKGVFLTQDGRKYRELIHLEQIERWKERLFGFVSGVLVTVFGGVMLSLLAG